MNAQPSPALEATKEINGMTHDHRSTGIHQAELDREIDAIRNERLLASTTDHAGWSERARHAAGGILIAAGKALIGHQPSRLRTHRA
jgi:hypothetical protein